VLWWEDYQDVQRGRSVAGMLDRCRLTNTCPKILETFGATEFWDLRMSPGLIGTRADVDIPLPSNVRRYYFPGTTHGGGGGGFILNQNVAGGCVLQSNPNPESDTQRALFVALTDWVVNGIDMPPSAYPTLATGTLVPANKGAMGFPNLPQIPNDAPNGIVNVVNDYDFGTTFIYNDMSGVISREPPLPVKQVIPTYVVKTDTDGNEVAGVRSILHQLPLGTYLGWNVTASGFFKNQICAFTGGYVPFARTLAERLATGDPRLSIAERYTTVGNYQFAAAQIAKRMIAQRLLLPDDAGRIVSQALSQMTASGLLPLR